jgi:KDO2-lipid IV(A) lauroyltransferase
MRERFEYALAASVLSVLCWLPLKASYQVGYGVARLLNIVLPKLRRVAMRNLAMGLPELSTAEARRITDGVFRTVGRLLVAMARFPSIHRSNVGEWISYQGLEHYQAAKQKGRGILIATAHLGNWELSAFAHALMTEPMNVMVRPLDNPLVDRLVETRRTLSGNQLIFKKDAARTVLKALKLNQPVGILIDQNTTPSEGVFIRFFGKAACAGVAFAKLAYHSQAPVIPGFALWNEATNRYVLHFLPEVPMSGDLAADTQRIHGVLEEVIRQYPDQWMWIHRRWKTQPPGEPSFY